MNILLEFVPEGQINNISFIDALYQNASHTGIIFEIKSICAWITLPVPIYTQMCVLVKIG